MPQIKRYVFNRLREQEHPLLQRMSDPCLVENVRILASQICYDKVRANDGRHNIVHHNVRAKHIISSNTPETALILQNRLDRVFVH